MGFSLGPPSCRLPTLSFAKLVIRLLCHPPSLSSAKSVVRQLCHPPSLSAAWQAQAFTGLAGFAMLVIPLVGISPTLAPGKVEVLQAPSSFVGTSVLLCRRLKSLKHSTVEVGGGPSKVAETKPPTWERRPDCLSGIFHVQSYQTDKFRQVLTDDVMGPRQFEPHDYLSTTHGNRGGNLAHRCHDVQIADTWRRSRSHLFRARITEQGG